MENNVCAASRWRWALSLCLMAPGLVGANPFETTLENGLQVRVKEERKAPSVVHMLWYKAGSMDEKEGASGLAHVLEHMMFKRTHALAEGEFNRRVAAQGGRDNAFTSYDYTAYFQQVPPEALPEMMALEAERMQFLLVENEAFSREMEVVKEERRLRTDDNPQSLVFEQLMALAYQSHPYRRPIIGWMSDLERLRAQDARDWYAQWYAPNNATLVVVGDVDHQDVFRWAKTHYGSIPSRPRPTAREIVEPPIRGPRTAIVRAHAELPYLAMAWPAPSLRAQDLTQDPTQERTHSPQPEGVPQDVFALQVLSALLDGHESARFNRELIRGLGLATDAGSSYSPGSRGPSLFFLYGTPSRETPISALQTALLGQIERIAKEGIAQAELTRIQNQLLAGQVFRQDSLMGQAMELGRLAILDYPLDAQERILQGLRAVTAKDVQSVAQRYFDPTQVSTVILEPLPLAESSPATPRRLPSSPLRH